MAAPIYGNGQLGSLKARKEWTCMRLYAFTRTSCELLDTSRLMFGELIAPRAKWRKPVCLLSNSNRPRFSSLITSKARIRGSNISFLRFQWATTWPSKYSSTLLLYLR